MGRWASIRDLYIQATGDTPRAKHEAYSHLSEAERQLAGDVDVPELASIDESVTVTANTDYVNTSAIDFSVFAILDCFNVTDGIAMYPEPHGMTGRRLYLDTSGKPQSGQVTHYVRDGSRVYVRGTPSANTVLRVRVQRQMPGVTSSTIASADPVTPQQYDRALVHKAAELYFLLHPAENLVTDGERSVQQSSKHRDAYREIVAAHKPVRVEENRPRARTFRLSGFRATPRSRW